MIVSRQLYVAALVMVLAGCATTMERPVDSIVPIFGDSGRFGVRPDILPPEELHRLTPEQQADFLAYFNHPIRAATPPFRRVFMYLEEKVTDFQYQGDTLTATEALARNTGNCMSLAMVTTALAQLAGIQIGYQLMDDQPVFEYQGNTVRKGLHVSSIVYNPEWLAAAGDMIKQAAIGKGYRIDYFPSLRGRFVANLSYAEYLALYYSNVASDAILSGDYGTAYWYLQEALGQDPDHSASLNMLAVVNGRVGDVATAEQIYRYGITHAQDKLSLLKNYHILLVNQGRTGEAEQIQTRLDRMEDPSPYHWLRLARSSQAAGEWEDAIDYYRRAITLGRFIIVYNGILIQDFYTRYLQQVATNLRCK